MRPKYYKLTRRGVSKYVRAKSAYEARRFGKLFFKGEPTVELLLERPEGVEIETRD